MPAISIVVVHWREPQRLIRCLQALARDRDESLLGAGNVELVIVENGPEAQRDGDAAELDVAWPDRIRVGLSGNLGFAAGANLGIARARGGWVATLNDDTEVMPGFLAALQGAIERADSRCGALQPCLVRADDPTRVDSTGVSIHRDATIEDRDRGRTRGEDGFDLEVFCASAGAACYRRSMLEEIAPDGVYFDPGYFMYFEDVDLGWRCRLAGWGTRYVPEAVVLHAGHASAGDQPAGFVRRQCRKNRIRVVIANGSRCFVVRALPRLARDAGALVLEGGRRGAREVLTRSVRSARSPIERKWFGAG